MNSNITKRIWSVILVFAMVLSFVPTAPIFASAAETETGTKTDGQIVAENYALSETEKKLIASGYLVGATHSYLVPADNDNLITVDVDTTTITAKNYEGTDGYVWVPVSAVIEVSGTVEETVTFTGNQATYTYDGDAFAVKVNYELRLTVSESDQTMLLHAPFYLQQVMQMMDAIAAAREKLAIMEESEVVSILKEMNTAEGYPVMTNVSMYFRDEVFADAKYTEKEAATALLAQMDANGGKLNISVIADEYAAAASKIEYIINNADRINAEIISTRDYVYSITAEGCVLPSAATLAGYANHPMATALNSLINGLKTAVTYLEEATMKNCASGVKDVVKPGLNATEYAALDTLVLALGTLTDLSSITVQNPLLADTAVVQFNMAMFDVTANVVLKVVEDVVGSDTLVTYDTKTVKITMAENATKAEIKQAILDSKLVSNALAEWEGKAVYVPGQYFLADETVLPETLTADFAYTATYEPNRYDLTFAENPSVEVPYGYQVLMTPHADATKSYDYFIGTTYYPEGSVYTVKGDTVITRQEGKAYTGYTVNGLVSNIYFGGDSKGQSILASGALNIGNDMINVRVPDNTTGIVTLNDNTLTANNYPSSYQGLEWVPYSYTVVDGVTNPVHYFNGNTATITEASYERVDVTYRLTLTNLDDAYVLQVAQLPATLATEAATQKSILDTLAGKQTEMGAVPKGALTAAVGMTSNEALKEVIQDMVDNCFDADGYLTIYNMMVAYSDANNGGLYYYYQNSAAVKEQINLLYGYLNTLMDGGDLQIAMEELLESVGAGGYISKLDVLKGYMEAAKDVPEANANINTNDAGALRKLCDALELSGTVTNVATVDDLYIDAPAITMVGSDKAAITVTVTIAGGASVGITPQVFNKEHKLTQDDINIILGEIETAIKTLVGENGKYYTNDYLESTIQALVNQQVQDVQKSHTFTWTPKEYTVKVEGVDADQTITINNLTVNLPEGTAAIRYEYKIDGATVSAGIYTFTLAQIDKLFTTGSYSIERVETNVEEENLIKFINDLNTAIGNNGIVFALTKDAAGEYAIVMKLNAANVSEITGAVKGMAMELATSYSYIAFGDNAMVYDDNGTKISIQAVIDTIMESSFGTEALTKLVDANGNIQNIAMPGTVLTDKAMTVAGGNLAETTLVLGNSATDVSYNVPMYITLGSAPSYLTQLRNLLANQLAPYFSFSCDNGKVNVGLNLPGKAYEAYLAVLLATDKADITDVNALNEDVALGFMMDIIKPLMESDASMSTVQNTLAKFGYNVDLTGYDQAFEYLRKLFKSTAFSYNTVDSTYDADANISIKNFVDSMNMGSVGSMVAEYETGLNLSLAINLKNLDKTYEALFFDIGAAGITNKFGLVENVSAKLPEIAGTAVVILLSDVNGDLTFNTTSVLNLNGYTVNGNVTGNGSLRIVDTNISDAVDGKVIGTISGNVKIAGGVYEADVTAFLTEGYSQDAATGKVSNNFFNLAKDENGNISVELNAGMLATNKMPEIPTLAVDIIAELLINGYTANSLYINDKLVYNIELNDLVGIYAASNTKEALMQQIMDMVKMDDIKSLINLVLADVTNFEGMLDAVKNDAALLSYDMKTGVWGFNVEYKESDDSFTASIVSNGEKLRKLNIVIVGNEADKQHFADLLGLLADTTDADVKVETMTGGKAEGGFKFNLGVSGNVVVDMSSDPKFAVMLGVILADGITDNADLVAGLKTYFEEGSLDALEAAFNKVKVSQVIDALENVHRGENLSTMLANLGLDGYDAADAIELEAMTGAFVKLVGAVLRRVNIAGTATTLGSFVDAATGAYTWDKENLSRSLSAALAGYTFTLEGTLVDGFVSIKLFEDVSAPVVNYDELKAQIAIAEALDKDKYTTDSWTALEAALEAAYAALNSQDQAVVDAAAEALKEAIKNLKEKPIIPIDPPVVIDYAELKAQIAAAEALIATDYTAESWAKLEVALEAAYAALSAKDQNVVDQAAADLKAAIEGLEKKPFIPVVDYTKLQELIAAAEALKEADYTSESWAKLLSALKTAKTALNSNSQAVVDAAAAELKAAIDGLEKKSEPPVVTVDYSKLQELIAAAEALKEADYTAESWANLQTALAAAKAALTSEDQAAVDAAAAALKAAIDGLEKKSEPPVVEVVDYTELKAQIAAAEALKEADYTAETWANLQTALTAAKAALTSDDQATVDAAAAALKAAIEALEEKAEEKAPVIWPWILLGVVVLGAGAAAVYFLIIKKKKLADNTPLVDYDIDDDM